MLTAVSYYRVSTVRQGKSGLGLEAQQSAVQAYAKANGIDLCQEFTEIESGKRNNRPVLLNALAYCRKHKTKLIIAKLDRLGRNVAFISDLMESNVSFVAVDNPQANELILHIMAAFAQHERKAISIRTKEALQAAKRRGQVLGKNGASLAKENQAKAEKFAKKMKPVIVELKAAGFTTVRALANEMNKREIPTAQQGGKWHRTSIHNLLKRL
ncbi:MAG: recombinase family protein [Chitinophagaceae bacterium]